MDYDTSAYDWSGLPVFCLTSRSLKWAVRGAGKQGKHVQITHFRFVCCKNIRIYSERVHKFQKSIYKKVNDSYSYFM